MILKDLNGHPHKISLAKNNQKTNKNKKYSKLHCKVRNLLKEIYPTITFLEDFPLITRPTLYADFICFSPFRLMIEADGRQHEEFCAWFYKNKLDFLKQKKNDRLKQEFCEINEIDLVRLKYNESEQQWRDKIKNRTEVERN